ncbi:potassium-transporting ATPase A subunit [Trinickia symbiotica]|nr:potassium-transporting ATPase subunit KdpA [Trinickia symbiotica]PPK42032.1 potassium-transporting ATPase A subunit [Trinickia symbiotica]
MLASGWFQTGLFLVVLIGLAKPLGLDMARVVEGNAPILSRIGHPLERFVYRAAGIDPKSEMSWKSYAVALIVFSGAGTLFLYALQRFQSWLPFNPQSLPSVAPISRSTRRSASSRIRVGKAMRANRR